jgi:hypothetical protein
MIKNEKWTLHSCSPFDFGWEFTLAVPASDVRLYQLLSAARSAEPGWEAWEGDFAHEPRYLVWPTRDVNLEHGYIWKQSNNGTTFIATRSLLPNRGEFVGSTKAIELRVD